MDAICGLCPGNGDRQVKKKSDLMIALFAFRRPGFQATAVIAG